MHMATAHSHILRHVRNLSEVKLQRREEVHAALCLLHVMFPLLLSARNGCFVRCVRVHLMHCGPLSAAVQCQEGRSSCRGAIRA